MGIYVNPGNISFKEACNSMIYVDKSGLISYTNRVIRTKQKYVCVSRPRRFGKSMAADMLVAYYSKGCDSRELFTELAIKQDASFEKHLNKYHVIRFDVQQFLFHKSHQTVLIEKIQEAIIEELRVEYGDYFEVGYYGLQGVLNQIYARTGQGFVFVIDEWDCVFRLAREAKELQKEYLDFLRALFKGPEYVELVYMTGILPIKKYGEHSALNIFREFSVLHSGKLAPFFGFTEKEVEALCLEYGIDYEKAKQWYDGYLIGGQHMYNPHAITELMEEGTFQSYWTGTETYEALKIYIDQDFDGLKQAITAMLGNVGCKVNPQKFENDMTTFRTRNDVLTLLIHLGYLTYNEETKEALIPNQEIAQEFLNAMEGASWDGVIQALSRSEELLKSTWALDGEAVADGISMIHNETASILQYNSENSLTCTVLLAYYSAKAYYLNPILELPSGKGFADVVYLPKRNSTHPALVIELKWDKSAKGAIRQIQEKEYASWIEGYTGEILLVGINYDTKMKEHSCVIEQHRKLLT